MNKRFLGFLLVCVLLFSVFGAHAWAASPSGSCGKNVSWSLNQSTGVLTVKGQGAMDDYEWGYDAATEICSSNAPWWDYRHQIRAVVVEEGVTGVGACAFWGNYYMPDDDCYFENLTSLALADSVISIGNSAFQCCDLQTVKLGAGLKTIGEYAFCDNTRLTAVSLPEGLTTIGRSAFAATGMTEVVIPRSVVDIGDGAFGVNTPFGGGCIISLGFTVIGYPGTAAESYYEELLAGYNEEKRTFGSMEGITDNYPPGGTVYFKAITAAPVNVSVDGAAVRWTDAEPFIDENSRTMVPLRAVAEALGLTVSWDGAKREAGFTDGKKTIIFPIGSSAARTGDGGSVQMDTAAVIVNDRTYAPVRYLAEFFGFTVGWDGATKTVLIGRSAADSAGEAGWYGAYRDFVMNEAFLSAGQEYAVGTTGWGNEPLYVVYLYDMDSDDVPELMITNGEEGRAVRCAYIYGFDGSSVFYLGIGPTDAYYDPDKPNGIYGYFHIMGDDVSCTLYEKNGRSIETTYIGEYSSQTWPENLELLYWESVKTIRGMSWETFVRNAGY